MITGLRINIFGIFETFEYALHIYLQFNMNLYCEDTGFGALSPILTWKAEDDSEYIIWGYLNGPQYLLNNTSLRYDCYGDIIITRTRHWDDLPISIDLNHINDYFTK